MTTTASPPTPPLWEESIASAVQALSPFIVIPLNPSSSEYNVLSELVTSSPNFRVTGIEKVINPALWNKFVAIRKELLSSKCNDLDVLGGLGLTNRDFQQQVHIMLNFDPPRGVPSYADNVALLFHCTRGKVATILTQGLDERLGNIGRMGRGIYFAG